MTERDDDRSDTAADDYPSLGATLDSGEGPEPIGPTTQLPEQLEPERRYEVRGQLGAGGMGEVRLCLDRSIGRTVAMKVIREDRMQPGHQARARFIHEARVQGRLEHPAVVPVYDLGVDRDKRVWFTMKRVRGVSLETILRTLAGTATGPLTEQYSPRRLLAAFSRICLAIDFAHERGVVHRDLKPSNIMLGDYGEAYVLDWGVAKVLTAPEPEVPADSGRLEAPPAGTPETLRGAVLGSPGYMSPEQLQELDVGPRADVYALGAILFEILALEPLHQGRSSVQLVTSTLRGADARPSVRAPRRDVAPELDAVCVKATSLDPADRHASARELHEAVERWLDGARDAELRRDLSARHAAEAAAAAERAMRDDDEPLEQRRRAMRAAGRAIALDPTNEEALGTMVRLLEQPPRQTPPEVLVEQHRSYAHRTRWNARAGALSYGVVLLFALYLPKAGVGDWRWFAAFVGLVGAALGLSVWQGWVRRAPSSATVLATFVLSSAAFATVSTAFGPLILGPVAIAANTAAFAANMSRRLRPGVLAVGALAVVGPIVLERLGMLPASYRFAAGTMTLQPGLSSLPETATIVFLTIASLAAVVANALVASRSRDLLHDAERQIMTYAWHLRELVPPELRASTDPTPERRARPSP